jgi:hypothetical protein
MTKHREQLAKSHQSKAKEKTKHEQIRETHLEEKVEGGSAEPSGAEAAPNKKSREEANPAAANRGGQT